MTSTRRMHPQTRKRHPGGAPQTPAWNWVAMGQMGLTGWTKAAAKPTEGILSLYINQEKVGEQKIKTQPAKVSLAGEGLNVGLDRAEPVTDDYPGTSPWAFTGGTIHQVIVDVAGDPWVDLEKEVRRRSHVTDN